MKRIKPKKKKQIRKKKIAEESGASAAVVVDHNDADSNLVKSTKWIKKVADSLIAETRGTKIGTHGLGGEGRSDQFKSDGLEVEESRTALPIAKVMRVFQLKYKGVSYEKDVLSILNQKANERFKTSIYSSLRSIFNQLEDEVNQVLLLCGVLGPSISVSNLLKYVIGLGVFKHVNSIDDARSKLDRIIGNLEKSLLLHYSAREVKVPDLICDVASFIASRHHNAFTRNTCSLKDWPGEGVLASCTQIILKRCNIQTLPKRLDCPVLDFLYLDTNDNRTLEIPHSFFEGTGNLQVLVFIGVTMPSLPASLVFLAKLKTLCLNQCCLQDMVEIGALKSLEILSFFQSSMKEFPSEIGQLTRLTSLEFQIPEASILPSSMIFDTLEEFNIVIGDQWEWSDSNATSRLLKLKLHPNIHLEQEIKAIVESAQDLYLEIDGLQQIWPDPLAVDQVFEKLKTIKVNNCDRPEYLFLASTIEKLSKLVEIEVSKCSSMKNIVYSCEKNEAPVLFPNLETMILDNLNNLEEICPAQPIIDSFQNLKVIKVNSCDRLKYLFLASTIKKFSKLVEIEVSKCSSMKNIVLLDSGTTINEIESIPVRSLTLQHLPHMNGSGCNDLRHHIPTLFPNEELEKDRNCKNFQALFRPLKHLKLICISSIKLLVITALSNGMVPLRNLETMEIEDCYDLKYLFVIKGLNMHENYGGLLPHLCQLHLSNLGELRSIVGLNHPGETLSFKMLKHLTVRNCNQLRYVLPLYVIQNLQQLENIEISECKMLERAFGDEDDKETKTATTVQLLQVKSLILEKLPKLSGFCQDGCTVEWLSLKTVKVDDCPMLQKSSLGKIERPLMTFVRVTDCKTWASNVDPENIVYLFHLTGQIPEDVQIKDSEELKTYVEMKLQLTKLKTVEALQCDNELTKFLSILLNHSYKLEQLKVRNCELLEQVLDLTEFFPNKESYLKFPNLITMQLDSLPKLNCIWNKDPTGILGLNKLTKLEIIKCGLPKSPLTTPMLEELVSLEELKIESCENIEFIVEDDKEERSFGNLKDLHLASLPKLIKFNTGHCNFKFPNLVRLTIEKCPELNAFTTGFLIKTTNEGTSSQVPSDEKMDVCSKLEKLKLVRNESLEEIWPAQGSRIQKCELKEIEVVSFSNLVYIFPSSMLQIMSEKLEKLVLRNCSSLSNVFQLREGDSIKAFENLKILTVKGCGSLERLLLPSSCPNLTDIDISDCGKLQNIFIGPKIKAEEKRLPNLKSIALENLPALSIFSLEIFEFPKLQKARIVNCPTIKTFSRNVSDKAGNSIDTDSSKSRLSGHRKLKLRNLKPQIRVFQKLTSLDIVGCESIEKLFSISVAQDLSSLKLLTLYKCENMVQVLHQDGRETSKQVFEKLETLVLKHLPKLTSFCEEDFDFREVPELKMVRVENIPNMETFVKKPLNTPKLKQVHVTPITKCWHQNLNQTINLLHENHDKLKDDVWESDDQSSTAHHTDDAESSLQEGCPHRKEGESAHATEVETGYSGDQKQSVGAAGVTGWSDDASCDKKKGMGDRTAETTATGSVRGKQELDPATVNDFSGGYDHLGPQMLLRRDLWKGIQSLARSGGVKREGPMISQGVMMVGENLERLRGSDILNETREKSVGVVMGAPKIKAEWVAVGSKRKKDEKVNRIGGRHKIKQMKQMEAVHRGPHLMELNNAFSCLQDLSPDCLNSAQQKEKEMINRGPHTNTFSSLHELPQDNVKSAFSMHGNMHSHVNSAYSIHGDIYTNGTVGDKQTAIFHRDEGAVTAISDIEGVAPDAMVDVNMGLDGREDNTVKTDILSGSGLAPKTFQLS